MYKHLIRNIRYICPLSSCCCCISLLFRSGRSLQLFSTHAVCVCCMLCVCFSSSSSSSVEIRFGFEMLHGEDFNEIVLEFCFRGSHCPTIHSRSRDVAVRRVWNSSSGGDDSSIPVGRWLSSWIRLWIVRRGWDSTDTGPLLRRRRLLLLRKMMMMRR